MIVPPRHLRLGATVLVAVAALYSALWTWAARSAEREVDAFLEAGTAQGMVTVHGASAISGFPFRFELTLPNITVTGLPRLPEASVTVPSLTIRAHPLSRGEWNVTAPAGFVLDLPVNGGKAHVAVQESALDLGPGAVESRTVGFRAGGITVTSSGGSARLDSVNLHLAIPDHPTEERVGAQLGFDLDLSGLALPHRLGPLGPVIDRIAFDGQINGDVPQTRLGDALTSWRDQGGTIELRGAHVTWGKVQVDAEGTVALDHDMQPEAAFSAEVRNWGSFLDALVDGGSMKPSEAAFAKIVLALLSGVGIDGSTPLKTPIAIQKSQVFVEKAHIAQLPHFDWP